MMSKYGLTQPSATNWVGRSPRLPIFVPVTGQSCELHVSVLSGCTLRIRFPGPMGEGRDSPEEPGGVNFQRDSVAFQRAGTAAVTAPSGRTRPLSRHTPSGARARARAAWGCQRPRLKQPGTCPLQGALPQLWFGGLQPARAFPGLQRAARRSTPARPCPRDGHTRSGPGEPRAPYALRLPGGLLTLLAVPSWRLPFAVTCPDPRQGCTDQLITRGRDGGREGGRPVRELLGARARRPRPRLWRAWAPRPRPPAGPAHHHPESSLQAPAVRPTQGSQVSPLQSEIMSLYCLALADGPHFFWGVGGLA